MHREFENSSQITISTEERVSVDVPLRIEGDSSFRIGGIPAAGKRVQNSLGPFSVRHRTQLVNGSIVGGAAIVRCSVEISASSNTTVPSIVAATESGTKQRRGIRWQVSRYRGYLSESLIANSPQRYPARCAGEGTWCLKSKLAKRWFETFFSAAKARGVLAAGTAWLQAAPFQIPDVPEDAPKDAPKVRRNKTRGVPPYFPGAAY